MQVATAHYDFLNYIDLNRWNSCYHQITETLALNPQSVLIVGKGDKVVETILSKQNLNVTTFDFDETLQPDILGDVTNIRKILENSIQKRGGKFDVLLCCQVLEHVPYENFENILQQLQSIAKNVILSIPYSSVKYYLHMRLPIVKEIKMQFCIHKFWSRHKFDGQHFWEIGFAGYPKRRIIKDIKKFFHIKKQFLAENNPYHLFFVLQFKI
ncbi:MAG: methyltransferase domain-containing protein [Prevotellaceae bacterium]|jgi:hypothetical protein|nr:methyltransferase domain-containing protein [Prevotellaceae bacterium]